MSGDINKHIGSDHLGFPGNSPYISRGGHLLRELLESGDYFLANAMEKAEGGPFIEAGV